MHAIWIAPRTHGGLACLALASSLALNRNYTAATAESALFTDFIARLPRTPFPPSPFLFSALTGRGRNLASLLQATEDANETLSTAFEEVVCFRIASKKQICAQHLQEYSLEGLSRDDAEFVR